MKKNYRKLRLIKIIITFSSVLTLPFFTLAQINKESKISSLGNLSVISHTGTTYEQSPSLSKWQDTGLFDRKVFVENKGQFNGKDALKNSQIKFGYNNLGFEVYFTNKGLIYSMEEWGISEAHKERLTAEIEKESNGPGIHRSQTEISEEEELKRPDLLKSSVIHLDWIGANPNPEIIPGKMANEYFNYLGNDTSKNINFCKSYETLTYKNLYPGIDLVYSFPEGKQGFKYALIVSPGANVNKVKMKYSGANKISFDKAGNIHISNGFGDIIDHAPLTYYSDNDGKKIASSFVLNGNEISFDLGSYNTSKGIVIDPWTTNPNFTLFNRAVSLESDAAGNFYVMGGYNPYKLMKYNSAGVALWTTNLASNLWYSSHATDNSGNSFCSGMPNIMHKINNAGVITNTVMITSPPMELWFAKFNKSKTQLVAGSEGGWSRLSYVNQTTCQLNGLGGVNFGSVGNETRDCAWNDNGNLFGLCVSNTTVNVSRLWRLTPALTMMWNVPSGYINMEYDYISPGFYGAGYFGPHNALAASNCYVYTYCGSVLYKRSILNGAFVASVTVVGAATGSCGGIIVDSCENVYVGTINGISKFNGNLTLVASAVTAGAIYDLEFGINNEIYACGNGVCTSVAGLKQTCAIGTLTLIPSSGPACNNNGGFAAVTVLGGVGPYTYTWSNGGNASSITNMPPGTYTVNVQDNSCLPLTKTISITILSLPGGTVSITSSGSVACNGFTTGNATANVTGGTGPYTYTWSNNQNTQTATNLGAGNYTIVTTDANGCLSSATLIITEPPAITGTIVSSNVLCNASTTGSANINAGGGTGTLNYSWSNGPTTQPNINLASGTYSCIVTDVNGCQVTVTVQITQPTPLTLTINSSATNVCAGSVINLNSFAGGGTGPYTYTWTPGPVGNAYNVLEALPGNYNYILTSTDANGCLVAKNINLTFDPIPAVSATSQTVCSGQKVELTANGAEHYVWHPGNVQGNTFTATCTSNMFLTVIGTSSSGGCSSSATASVIVNPLPTAQIAANTNKGCVPLCITFTASNSSGAIQTCSWAFGNGSFASNIINTSCCFNLAGSYLVNATIADNRGCISTTTYSIETYPIPVADFNYSPLKPIENEKVIFTDATHGATVAKWDWYFKNLPIPHSNLQNPTYSYPESGTYPVSLLVTSNHGCTDTIVKTIFVCEDYSLYVPNTFTPNDDGVNDVFQPKGFGIKKYELRVFNRWGEQLFSTNDLTYGWDGMYKDELCPDNTYIWKINLTTIAGKSHELTGHVMLNK